MSDFGEAYATSSSYSEEKLRDIRRSLAEGSLETHKIVVFGSYARREASTLSDLDYVVIEDESKLVDTREMDKIQSQLKKHVKIEPSADGAFGKKVFRDSIFQNIGGLNDTNESLTRRMLFLLESDYLSGEKYIRDIRHKIVEEYISLTVKNHSLALFLLNDIIRYWRTITVDYRFKTHISGKPWAIRNIKLVFSRKLMYAGGIFSVAMTADRSAAEKRRLLKKYFDLPALERIVEICGIEKSRRLISLYNNFLKEMENEVVRDELKAVQSDDHFNDTFRRLKDDSYRFNRELLKLLDEVFHESHPIHRSLIF